LAVSFKLIDVFTLQRRSVKWTADGTVNADMQKKYLDQALKVLNPKEAPTVEKLYSYGLARKVNAELDAAGWKPGK